MRPTSLTLTMHRRILLSLNGRRWRASPAVWAGRVSLAALSAGVVTGN